jgi:hypothetical protein
MRMRFQRAILTILALFLLSVHAGCHAPAAEQAPQAADLAELLQLVHAKSDAVANSKLTLPARDDVVMPESLRALLRRDDVKKTRLYYGFEMQDGNPGWFWSDRPYSPGIRIVGDYNEVKKSLHAHLVEHGFEPVESPPKPYSLAFRKQYQGALESVMLDFDPATGSDPACVLVESHWRIEGNRPAALTTFAEVRRAMPSLDPPMEKSEPPMLVLQQLSKLPVDQVAVHTHGKGENDVLYVLSLRVPDSAMNAAQRDALADQVIEVLTQNHYEQFNRVHHRLGESGFKRNDAEGAFIISRAPSHLEIMFLVSRSRPAARRRTP